MHPVLELGGRAIPAYPVMVTASVLLCWVLLLRRTRRLGYSTGAVLLWVALAFPVGGLGGRALADLVGAISGPYESGGMTVLGSVLACIAFSAIYVPRAFGEPASRLLDAVAFTLPLSIGLGRFACLLNGCCFGGPCTQAAPWALDVAVYQPGTEAYAMYGGDSGRLLYNLPLLLGLWCALALVLVEWVYRRRERLGLVPGTVVACAVLLDAVGRMLLEPLRGGAPTVWMGISPWQGIAAVVAVGAGLVLVRSHDDIESTR